MSILKIKCRTYYTHHLLIIPSSLLGLGFSSFTLASGTAPPVICVPSNNGKCVIQGDEGLVGGDGGAGGDNGAAAGGGGGNAGNNSGVTQPPLQSTVSTTVSTNVSTSSTNPVIYPTTTVSDTPSIPMQTPNNPISPILKTQINYMYRKQEANSKPQPLINDSVLQSGDGYKIVFTPEQITWVYIFQTDSSGKMFQLFPQNEMFGVAMNQTNPVAAGETRTVPMTNAWFSLDNQVGTETIYFITTSQQDQELEMGYKNYQQAQNVGANESLVATTAFKRSVAGRGPASIAFDESPVTKPYTVTTETGENFVLDTGYFTGRCSDVDGCANVLKFQHQ